MCSSVRTSHISVQNYREGPSKQQQLLRATEVAEPQEDLLRILMLIRQIVGGQYFEY